MNDRGHSLTLPERVVFGVANLERGVVPALAWGVNEILPRLMHLAADERFQVLRGIPYKLADEQPIRLDVIRPAGPGPFPVVVGIHGGAWMIGRKENLRHAGTWFAKHGFLTVLINYRLAPAHRWPAQAEDVRDALIWVRRNAEAFGGRPDRIGVFGDSAGGHLSAWGAAVTARAEDPELPTIAAAAHWYGVFDFEKFSRVPWHRTPQILEALFGDDRSRWREASPRYHLDDPGRPLPPTMLFAAGGDPLWSQSLMYARELRQRGVEVELKKYKRNIHGFLNLPMSPECRASLKHSARWFDRWLRDDQGAQAA
ncbi:MAG: alpha/beta hydrolase [Candidatus Dadabacteria bacterium]|nr:MAG: alpha/beta hydrolase [Candidatus Dadabacteria bacterium]